MESEHSYIEINGIKMHVVQAGSKSGVPVILLHSFPNFGMDRHNPQNGLVSTKRFVISPLKPTKHG